MSGDDGVLYSCLNARRGCALRWPVVEMHIRFKTFPHASRIFIRQFASFKSTFQTRGHVVIYTALVLQRWISPEGIKKVL